MILVTVIADPDQETTIREGFTGSSTIQIENVLGLSDDMEEAELRKADCLLLVFREANSSVLDTYARLRVTYPEHPIVAVTDRDDMNVIESIISDEVGEYVYAPMDEKLPIGLLAARIQRLVLQ